jgi:hypothetical protein
MKEDVFLAVRDVDREEWRSLAQSRFEHALQTGTNSVRAVPVCFENDGGNDLNLVKVNYS